MSMAAKSPEERAAAAQKLRDEGDSRPVSQIEAEMLAQDEAGQPVADQDAEQGKGGAGKEGKP